MIFFRISIERGMYYQAPINADATLTNRIPSISSSMSTTTIHTNPRGIVNLLNWRRGKSLPMKKGELRE